MKHAFIPLLITIVVSGNAQSLLSPGPAVFEKKWMSNNTARMVWYVVKNDAKIEIGEVTTRTVLSKARVLVITEISLKNNPSPWVDSTIADAENLSPIHHSSYNGQRNMVLEFGNIVTGCYYDKTKDSTTFINDITQQSYFDSNLYPVLIGWLPLREGYRQDIAIYDFNPASKSGIKTASVKEVKSGIYNSTKSGARPVWIVTVSDEINNAGNSRYYFDQANRKLWKQEIEAGERKMIMESKE